MARNPRRRGDIFNENNPFISPFDVSPTGGLEDISSPKPSPRDPWDDSITPKPSTAPRSAPTTTPTPPAPTATERLLLPEYNGRPQAPSLAGITTYDTPEESIDAYAKWLSGQQGQSRALAAGAIESGDYSGLRDVDINSIRQDPIRL
jgi:hypothetical protein